MPNESEGNYVNTEVDLPQSTDRLYEQPTSFATSPLFRTMKRQRFPGVMTYPFENPDATYPSCNSSKQNLEERSIAPPSMGAITEAEGQELPLTGTKSKQRLCIRRERVLKRPGKRAEQRTGARSGKRAGIRKGAEQQRWTPEGSPRAQ